MNQLLLITIGNRQQSNPQLFFIDFHRLLSAVSCYRLISLNIFIDCHQLILVYRLTTPENKARN